MMYKFVWLDGELALGPGARRGFHHLNLVEKLMGGDPRRLEESNFIAGTAFMREYAPLGLELRTDWGPWGEVPSLDQLRYLIRRELDESIETTAELRVLKSRSSATGDPELDALIEEFRESEFDQEDLVERGGGRIDAMADPDLSLSMCDVLTSLFKTFLAERGIESSTLEVAVPLEGNWVEPNDRLDTQPRFYEDRSRADAISSHTVNLIKRPGGTYVVDWTARQYDSKYDFPATIRLQNESVETIASRNISCPDLGPVLQEFIVDSPFVKTAQDDLPHYPDVVYGWKILNIHEDGRLYSPHQRTVWPSGQYLEANKVPDKEEGGFNVPGIHAVMDEKMELLRDYISTNSALVKIAMVGKIVEHDQGYRCQFAYPSEIYLTNLDKANLIRAKYPGVEVSLIEKSHGEAIGLVSAIYDVAWNELYRSRPQRIDALVEEAVKQGAELRGASLKWANLAGADLREAKLWGADLRWANLKEANLEGADLERANLGGADLEGAYLQRANLGWGHLWGANLQGANLWGANLWGANLQGANLQGANLWGANLQGANLEGANLEGANLEGANLQGAELRGASLEGAIGLKRTNRSAATIPATMYHSTLTKNVPRIMQEGLKLNRSDEGFTTLMETEKEPWFQSVYGVRPIFLSIVPGKSVDTVYVDSNNPKDYTIFRVDVTGLPLAADLPGLYDNGAALDESGKGMWYDFRDDNDTWTPEALKSFERDDLLYYEDLLGPAADAAIQTTGTAACLSDIPPERIEIYKFDTISAGSRTGSQEETSRVRKISAPPAEMAPEFLEVYRQTPPSLNTSLDWMGINNRGYDWQIDPTAIDRLKNMAKWSFPFPDMDIVILHTYDYEDAWKQYGSFRILADGRCNIVLHPFIHPEQVSEMLWHEIQHVYQHYEDRHTTQDYVSPYLDRSEDNFAQYWYHPSEVDAREFAEILAAEELIQLAPPISNKDGRFRWHQIRNSLAEEVSLFRQNKRQWELEIATSRARLGTQTRKQRLQYAESLPPDQSRIVYRDSDGWSIRRLETLTDEWREGCLMGHCWAPDDLVEDEDWERIEGNPSFSKSYSLRDPDNLPHASFYLLEQPDMKKDWGYPLTLVEVEDYDLVNIIDPPQESHFIIFENYGQHNDWVKPEYLARIEEWARTLGVAVYEGAFDGGLERPYYIRKMAAPPGEIAPEFLEVYRQTPSLPADSDQELRGYDWQINPEAVFRLQNMSKWALPSIAINILDPMDEEWRRLWGIYSVGQIRLHPLQTLEQANNTLWHEIQHAFQDVENRMDLSDYNDDNHNHPVEIDARSFAEILEVEQLIQPAPPLLNPDWVPDGIHLDVGDWSEEAERFLLPVARLDQELKRQVDLFRHDWDLWKEMWSEDWSRTSRVVTSLQYASIRAGLKFSRKRGGMTWRDNFGPDLSLTGYFVGRAGHEVTTPISLLDEETVLMYADTVESILDREARLGLWFNRGVAYLDVSTYIANIVEAAKLGKANEQDAIYDIASGDSIYLVWEAAQPGMKIWDDDKQEVRIATEEECRKIARNYHIEQKWHALSQIHRYRDEFFGMLKEELETKESSYEFPFPKEETDRSKMASRIKYPRTPHLPFSPGGTSDDVMLSDFAQFEGKEVVVTEKMDGENITMYRNYIHARSLDSRHHPSRDWIKGLHGQIAHNIPDGWRIVGENLYAQHSITYSELPSYFFVFSIWDENNICLSWDETRMWAELLGLHIVPELYRGRWSEQIMQELFTGRGRYGDQEGFVVRNADSFSFDQFGQNVAKYVREEHVQTDEHWMTKEIVPNELLPG